MFSERRIKVDSSLVNFTPVILFTNKKLEKVLTNAETLQRVCETVKRELLEAKVTIKLLKKKKKVEIVVH
jgi:hypothetical protein